MSMIDQMSAAVAGLSDADRDRLKRELSGVAEQETIRRGQVYTVIRELRVSVHSLRARDYQAALHDVQQAVSKIEGQQL